ncbi:acyltransferase [Pararcticibacter amylolyticus]|uniref:Acyltransferase n=1 Tax=Pararcticibacter amylolyticus TaxID=2173175 RepID=A0A2U2PBQ0_9SPHI|nr:acyltransferase [Pararcticibacter amylolyticus]PWG78724.1 acyltransferase [Pararcticibacter amylolyticus]
MKNLFRRILLRIATFIGYIGSLLMPYKLNVLLGVFGDAIYTKWVSSALRKVGSRTSIMRGLVLLNGKYIEIGKDCSIGTRVVLTAWDRYLNFSYSPSISIGDNVVIGDESHITAISQISIGNNVTTGRRITITDNSHGLNLTSDELNIPPLSRQLHSKGPVFIEDNVWIGDKVTILPGVRIGFGSIVGANAVVTKDIPAYSIVGGNPARILKQIV